MCCKTNAWGTGRLSQTPGVALRHRAILSDTGRCSLRATVGEGGDPAAAPLTRRAEGSVEFYGRTDDTSCYLLCSAGREPGARCCCSTLEPTQIMQPMATASQVTIAPSVAGNAKLP